MTDINLFNYVNPYVFYNSEFLKNNILIDNDKEKWMIFW